MNFGSTPMRRCAPCGIYKTLSEFPKNKHNKLGIGYECLTCKRARSINYRQRPEVRAQTLAYSRDPQVVAQRKIKTKHWRASIEGKRAKFQWRLKEKYGIEIEDWAQLLNKQDCSCAICKAKFFSHCSEVTTDHCHQTGKVRGLLCSPCNLLLGFARDNSSILGSAMEYLDAHD